MNKHLLTQSAYSQNHPVKPPDYTTSAKSCDEKNAEVLLNGNYSCADSEGKILSET